MKKKILATIALLSLMLLFGCGEKQQASDPTVLPNGAKIIADLGNGWVVFERNVGGKTRKFMYHRSNQGNRSYEAITELKD